jgi:hypothetical protein
MVRLCIVSNQCALPSEDGAHWIQICEKKKKGVTLRRQFNRCNSSYSDRGLGCKGSLYGVNSDRVSTVKVSVYWGYFASYVVWHIFSGQLGCKTVTRCGIACRFLCLNATYQSSSLKDIDLRFPGRRTTVNEYYSAVRLLLSCLLSLDDVAKIDT